MLPPATGVTGPIPRLIDMLVALVDVHLNLNCVPEFITKLLNIQLGNVVEVGGIQVAGIVPPENVPVFGPVTPPGGIPPSLIPNA